MENRTVKIDLSKGRVYRYEVPSHAGRQWLRYQRIEDVLKECLIVLEEIGNDALFDHFSERGRLMQKAAFNGIIISYGRCFVKAEGNPSLEISKIPLEPNEIIFHGSIMELRHKYVAHADIYPKGEDHKTYIDVHWIENGDDLIVRLAYNGKSLYNLTQASILNFIKLINKIIEFIQPKIIKLTEKINLAEKDKYIAMVEKDYPGRFHSDVIPPLEDSPSQQWAPSRETVQISPLPYNPR